MCVAWSRRLWDGVVCAEDFKGARVARCAGVGEHDVVEGRVLLAEAREADTEDHGEACVAMWCYYVDAVMVQGEIFWATPKFYQQHVTVDLIVYYGSYFTTASP